VFFTHRLQAVQLALRRCLQGQPLAGWYWRPALPGVDVRAPAQDVMAQLFAWVGRWPEAVAAVPVLMAEARAFAPDASWSVNLPPVWLKHLRPMARVGQDGVPEAMGDCSWSSNQSPQTHAFRSSPAVTSAPGDRNANRPVPQTSNADARSLLTPQGAATGWPPSTRTARAEAARESASAAVAKADLAGPLTLTSGRGTAAPAEVLGHPACQREPANPHNTPEGPPESVDSECWPELAVTEAAGLLFLWPMLERLGLAEWDALHPDAWMAPRVLGLALQRLRVPATDPAWALQASLPRPVAELPVPDHLAQQWLRACRREARCALGIGLASLAVRPGWLGWSATHIDVHFSLHDADLRVRRAALDTDPGWVGALQRVVAFHYDQVRGCEGPSA
jgi:hypothetical protein